MKALVLLVVTVVSIAYPVLVYFGVQFLSPAIFSLILVALTLMRLFVVKDRLDSAQIFLLLLVIPFSLALLVTNSVYLLKLYPAVISFGVAILFAMSLKQEESLIEKMARLSGKTITPRAKVYTRRLTLIWAILLLINVLVVLYFAFFAPFAWWTLYCGLISYFIFGGIFAIELIYRRYYIAKYGA